MPEFLRTYYSDTQTDRAVRPAAQDAQSCQVAIVGGGLAALNTGLELARRQVSVIILEAKHIGWGASGRNGGIVSPAFACDGDAISRKVGSQAATALHRLTIEGVETLRANIQTLGLADAAPVSGLLNLRRFDQADDLKAYADSFAKQFGYVFDYLDQSAIEEKLSTRRYVHGLRDAQAFHIHPLNYLRGLAREFERLGGRIYEHSLVVSHQLHGPIKRLTVQTGAVVDAQTVVFATGGYTGGLVPRLQRAILPIATYMMISEPAPELLATVIKTQEAVLDDRRASDYYRLVEGGKRLLWGGRITTRAASVEGVARELRREMIGAYPQLAGLKTDVAWSGLMGYARHLMPQIGQMSPDVWHCTAFGGHGLNTTAIAGKVLAEAIFKETDRISMFSPFGLNWAGGPIGLAAAQLTYWKLQAQDWWRER